MSATFGKGRGHQSSCKWNVEAGFVGAESLLFYCLGMRPREPLTPFGSAALGALLSQLLPRHVFTLEALNWTDGSVAFTAPLGPGVFFNPLYAAVQVGDRITSRID